MRLPLLIATLLLAPLTAGAAPTHLVVWAWERPEDLRFLPADVDIAVQTGFVVLAGDGVRARGRRFALRARPEQVKVAVVHVQVARGPRLAWTPAQRAGAAAAVLRLAALPGVRRVQLDFEIRRSERQVLLDLLRDVRAGLPRNVSLSMTALASWCETETWLTEAPVDEIVPMLFRMGPQGRGITGRLAAGGDFAERRCRRAMAVSADSPIARAPGGRRVYLFSPRSWTPADFETTRREVLGWPQPGA